MSATYRTVGGVAVTVASGLAIIGALWWAREDPEVPAADDEAEVIVWAEERMFAIGYVAAGGGRGGDDAYFPGDAGRRCSGWDYEAVTNGLGQVTSYTTRPTTNEVGWHPSTNVHWAANWLRLCAGRAQGWAWWGSWVAFPACYVLPPTNSVNYAGEQFFTYPNLAGWWITNGIGPTNGVYWHERWGRVPVYSNRVTAILERTHALAITAVGTNLGGSAIAEQTWTEDASWHWTAGGGDYTAGRVLGGALDSLTSKSWAGPIPGRLRAQEGRWSSLLASVTTTTNITGYSTQAVVIGYAWTNAAPSLDADILNTNVLNDAGRLAWHLTNSCLPIAQLSTWPNTNWWVNISTNIAAATAQDAYEDALALFDESWWQTAAATYKPPHLWNALADTPPPGAYWYYAATTNGAGGWDVTIEGMILPLVTTPPATYTNITALCTEHLAYVCHWNPGGIYGDCEYFTDTFDDGLLNEVGEPVPHDYGHPVHGTLYHMGTDYMLSKPPPPDWQGAAEWRGGFAWMAEPWEWGGAWYVSSVEVPALYEVKTWDFSGPTNRDVFPPGVTP